MLWPRFFFQPNCQKKKKNCFWSSKLEVFSLVKWNQTWHLNFFLNLFSVIRIWWSETRWSNIHSGLTMEWHIVAHFMKENGQFCTLAEFNTKFGTTVDFLTFNSCTSWKKQYIKKFTVSVSNNIADEINTSLSTIYSAPKGVMVLFYDVFVNDNSCLKWSEKQKSNVSWNTVFIKVQKN